MLLSENLQVLLTSLLLSNHKSINYYVNKRNFSSSEKEIPKSERYLEEASHYNDVKVPEEMQKRIWAKASAIIQKNITFVDMDNGIK